MTTETALDAARPGTTPRLWAIGLSCDSSESLDDLSLRFYERYDGVIASRDGRYVVTLLVTESNGYRAGLQSVQDIESVGFSVRKVDRDLVDIPEIAKRLIVSRQAVNLWATGKRADNFPPPLGSPGGKRIWAWGQIVSWAKSQGKAHDEPDPLTLDDAARLDVWLINRASAPKLRTVASSAIAEPDGRGKREYGSAGADLYRQASVNWLLET